MKLLFLGTGAADWNIAKRVDGAEHRRFSSALIDSSLLIDPGPHIFDYAKKTENPALFDKLNEVIVTHSHPDHLCPATVTALIDRYNVTIHGSKHVLQKLKEKSLGFYDISKIERHFHVIAPRDTLNTGKYTIKAVRSNHATGYVNEATLNYCIQADGKNLFYGLDGAWMLKETYREIRDTLFDAMVLEATVGESLTDFRIFEHNNIAMVLMMKNMFLTNGIANEKTHFIVTHIAKNLHEPHDDIVKRLRPENIDVAYDGLTITI